MNNLFFYLPLLYRYHTRERNLFLIPFALTDFFPPLIFVMGQCDFSIHLLIVFALSYFIMFSIYEVGYILNDAVTIKKEQNPMLRLTESELNYFEMNALKIFGIRFSFFILFGEILLWGYKYNISALFLCSGILLVAYFFHDYFRNSVNFLTNAILNFGKYLIPLLLFPISYKSLLFLLYFILFPLFRSVTYIVEKGTPKVNVCIFQIVYAVLVFILLIMLIYLKKIIFLSIFSFFIFCFIAYKIVVCIKKITKR